MTVHPHACGEHCSAAFVIRPMAGSSPRLWGTLKDVKKEDIEGRFIPTPVGNTPTKKTENPPTPVHPHACGEHIALNLTVSSCAGSSPRLWGTHYGYDVKNAAHRFIPTPVGNTCTQFVLRWHTPVHPHACGEHFYPAGLYRPSTGSSPRLWGTQLLALFTVISSRFIPTPVGNTLRVWP